MLIAALSRCIWFDDTRLSYLWFAWVELGGGIILHITILYLCFKFKDNLLYKDLPVYFKWYSILCVSIILSCIFHPGSKSPKYFVTKQMFVSLTMFIETLSLVAQLEHTKQNKAAEGLNNYYLMTLGVARFTRIAFWISYKAKVWAFWFLLVCDIVHTVLLLLFYRNYKAL